MDLSIWRSSLEEALVSVVGKFASFLPQLVAFTILMFVGWLCSRIVRKGCQYLFEKIGVDTLATKVGLTPMLYSCGIKKTFSYLISQMAFYLVFLVFSISALESLQLTTVSNTVHQFVNYFPNIIAASFILFATMFLGNLVKESVQSAAKNMKLDYGNTLGHIIYGLAIVIGSVVALSQLKIETALVGNILQITLIACGLVFALAFGLGAKGVAQSVISGIYLKDSLKEAKFISAGDEIGKVVEVGSLYTKILKIDGSSSLIPNKEMTGLKINIYDSISSDISKPTVSHQSGGQSLSI